MWHFEIWFSGGLVSVRLMVGFNDLKGLFQPKWFYDFLWCLCPLVLLVVDRYLHHHPPAPKQMINGSCNRTITLYHLGFFLYTSHKASWMNRFWEQHTWLKGSLSCPCMAASNVHIFTQIYMSFLYCLHKVLLAQNLSRTSFCIITWRDLKRRTKTGPPTPLQDNNRKADFLFLQPECLFWFGLDEYQVPTKTDLSLPLLIWTGERE